MSRAAPNGWDTPVTVRTFRVRFGRAYKDSRTGWRYKAVNTVRVYPCDRDQVLYRGVDGPDRRKWFSCSLAEFARRFVEVRVERRAVEKAGYPADYPAAPGPVAPVVEKVAGGYSKGSGV